MIIVTVLVGYVQFMVMWYPDVIRIFLCDRSGVIVLRIRNTKKETALLRIIKLIFIFITFLFPYGYSYISIYREKYYREIKNIYKIVITDYVKLKI